MQLNSLMVARLCFRRPASCARTSGRLLAFLFLVSSVFAQVSAILSGTVTDQSGAVVLGATVTVRNVDTGATRNTATDAGGHYQFFSLPVGQFEIRAGKAGFTEEKRTGVHLVVGQSATVDMNFKVGPSSEELTVTGDASFVGVSTASTRFGRRSTRRLAPSPVRVGAKTRRCWIRL